MDLVNQLMIGGIMIAITVAIHAIALHVIIRHAKDAAAYARKRTYIWKPLISSGIVVCVFSVHVVEIWLWAILFLMLDAVPITNLSDALYFSTATFTTVGYGDIVLDPSTRMLGAIEAANGFLLFGWTTAFIFEVISQIYKPEAKGL